jgi:perosamine synthetase
MYNIFLKKGDESRRDLLMRRMEEMGIETRPVFYPLHTLPPYMEERSYPVADLWATRGINLPTHLGLVYADVKRIAQALHKALVLL